jgi:hypothetical protein
VYLYYTNTAQQVGNKEQISVGIITMQQKTNWSSLVLAYFVLAVGFVELIVNQLLFDFN